MTTTGIASQATPTTALGLALQSIRKLLDVHDDVSDAGVKHLAQLVLKTSYSPPRPLGTMLRLIKLLEQEEAIANSILGDPDVEERALEQLRDHLKTMRGTA